MEVAFSPSPSPWVSCELAGGIGNRLFQLVGAMGLAERMGRRVVFYEPANTELRHQSASNIYSLFPQIEHVTCTDGDSATIVEPNGHEYIYGLDIPETEKNIIMYGYRQHLSYFPSYPIQPSFAMFSKEHLEWVLQIYDLDTEEKRCNTWFVHVRLGDFLLFNELNHITVESYHRHVLTQIPSDANIIVFSNEQEQAKEALQACGRDFKMCYDMDERMCLYIMSQCWGGAVAVNSTFSWWGSYLAHRSTPVKGYKSFIPDEWICGKRGSGIFAPWTYRSNISRQPKMKPSNNLIYMGVFYNEKYIRLLELLFLSLRVYSRPVDILVLTSDTFKEKIQALSSSVGLACHIHCLPCSTIFEAACARLHVFEWPGIDAYEKILYLDTDIIIRRDLSKIFEYSLEKKLYGIASGTLESPQFGGQFFDWSSCGIDHTRPGVNSGTLLFANCSEIRGLFGRINIHIRNHLAAGKQIPIVMDQPFINYHAFMSHICNTDVLKDDVSLYEDQATVENDHTASICHFSFPIGNFEHKYRRMSYFFQNLLITPEPGALLVDTVVGKEYEWNSGYIRFVEGTLETTWGKGMYSVLGPTMVYVVWNNHYHVLTFNSDFTEYISIRTAPMDFECVRGHLIEKS
jgi:hypothetical protein